MATDWKIDTLSDTDSNDSDKIFTVPENAEWEIMWIWVLLVLDCWKYNCKIAGAV